MLIRDYLNLLVKLISDPGMRSPCLSQEPIEQLKAIQNQDPTFVAQEDFAFPS